MKLDTNGTRPAALAELLAEGLLDYVAMDVKNSPERYPETVGRPDFDFTPVGESVSLLLGSNTDYEFRTTAVAQLHDESSFRGIGALIRGAKRWYLQPFVPRDSVPRQDFTPPDRESLLRYAEILRPFVDSVQLRGLDE